MRLMHRHPVLHTYNKSHVAARTAPPRPERRDEEALVVEADERADQAVVALPRGDAGVGAGDAGVDLPLLLHVRVLHDERVADLGLAPDLLTNWCREWVAFFPLFSINR